MYMKKKVTKIFVHINPGLKKNYFNRTKQRIDIDMSIPYMYVSNSLIYINLI